MPKKPRLNREKHFRDFLIDVANDDDDGDEMVRALLVAWTEDEVKDWLKRMPGTKLLPKVNPNSGLAYSPWELLNLYLDTRIASRAYMSEFGKVPSIDSVFKES